MLYRSLHNRDWKRVTSLQTAFLKWISLNGNTFIVILISARLVLGSPTDTKPAFVQVMVSWWRHQMEFSALLALCEGNPPVTGGSPQKGQWRRVFVFSFIAWTNGSAKNRDAGDLRCHRTHYDVTVLLAANSRKFITWLCSLTHICVTRIWCAFLYCMIFTHWSVGGRLNPATSSWFA